MWRTRLHHAEPVDGPAAQDCQQVTNNCTTAYPNGIVVDENAWWTSFGAAFNQLPPGDKAGENAPEMAVYECVRCGLDTVSKLPIDESIPAEAMGDPWVLPQPGVPPCPMCILDDDEIYLSIDDDYSNMTIDNVSVQLFDAAGSAESISYGRLPLTVTSVYIVVDPDLQIVDRSGLAPRTARVTMALTDNSSGSPVRIVASNEIPVQ